MDKSHAFDKNLVQLVIDRSKDYEFISLASNTLMERSIDRVKEFIRSRKCIVYGGTAIDYSLRLRGDKIYSDEAQRIPDLDFYSPNHVADAYSLADILFSDGNKNARAVVAIHTETMRVDVGDNNFIADISYVPSELFDALPTLEYDGMRILHPIYQRLDLHSSLSFPYDEPPREVVFHRWKKDVERFNKIDEKYPIEEQILAHGKVNGSSKNSSALSSASMPSMQIIRVPILVKQIIHGFAAFAAYIELYRRLGLKGGGEFTEGAAAIIDETMMNVDSGTNMITFTSPLANRAYDLIEYSPENMLKEIGISGAEHYEPFVNIMPEQYRFKANIVADDMSSADANTIGGKPDLPEYVIHSSNGKLLSVSTIKINGVTLRIACIQYVMKYMLGMYFRDIASSSSTSVSTDATASPKLYLICYNILLDITKAITRALENDEISDADAEPFMLKVKVYGRSNVSSARKLQLNSIYADLGLEPRMQKPFGYYPAKTHSLDGKPEWPKINLDLPMYNVLGRRINGKNSNESADS